MKKPRCNHGTAFKARVALEAIRENRGSLERRLGFSGGPDAWPSSEAWLMTVSYTHLFLSRRRHESCRIMPSITERRFQWRSTGSRRYRGEEGLTPQDIAIHHDYL